MASDGKTEGPTEMGRWISIEDVVPQEEVLVWTGERCVVACLVEGISAGKRWRVFMDARTDDILPWPSHWMPLPKQPPRT